MLALEGHGREVKDSDQISWSFGVCRPPVSGWLFRTFRAQRCLIKQEHVCSSSHHCRQLELRAAAVVLNKCLASPLRGKPEDANAIPGVHYSHGLHGAHTCPMLPFSLRLQMRCWIKRPPRVRAGPCDTPLPSLVTSRVSGSGLHRIAMRMMVQVRTACGRQTTMGCELDVEACAGSSGGNAASGRCQG